MALAVAGLAAEGETQIDDIGCCEDSYPDFVEQMKQLGAGYD
jgi:5-enolpyruvylshikimate-3-phosphate synthase